MSWFNKLEQAGALLNKENGLTYVDGIPWAYTYPQLPSISSLPSMAANAVTKTVSAPFIALGNTLKSWLMWLGLAFIAVIGLIIAIKLI